MSEKISVHYNPNEHACPAAKAYRNIHNNYPADEATLKEWVEKCLARIDSDPELSAFTEVVRFIIEDTLCERDYAREVVVTLLGKGVPNE